MKKIVRVVYDDEDKQLLIKGMSDNPCKECNVGGYCSSKSSCEKLLKFEKEKHKYESKGILDVATKISERKILKEKLKKDEENLRKIEKELPDFVLGNENPFRTNFYQKSLRDSGSITGNEFGVTISEGSKTLVYLDEVQKLIEVGALKVDYDVLEDYILDTRVEHNN